MNTLTPLLVEYIQTRTVWFFFPSLYLQPPPHPVLSFLLLPWCPAIQPMLHPHLAFAQIHVLRIFLKVVLMINPDPQPSIEEEEEKRRGAFADEPAPEN